ncbi:MAG: EamA family transporter [Candidatus Micrarchaeota archaeon]
MEFTWLVFALLSAIAAAFVAVFAKIGLTGIDANTATAIRAVIMAVFLFGVIVVQGKLENIPEILSNNKALTFIVLSGVAGALSWLFYFLALQSGKVAQVASIDRLSVVFAVVFAFLVLGEKINLTTGIGVAFITLGAIVIAVG